MTERINVSSTNRDECMKEYFEKKKLGKGAFGSVIQTCKQNNENDCNYVMKISKEDETFYRDVYFSKMLNNSGITPHFYDAWSCKGKGYMVLERYDGDLLKFAESNDKCETFNSLVIRKDFIEKMFEVVKTLTSFKVLHLDLKLDNFLYDIEKDKIVVTDFGFSTKFNHNFPVPKKIGWLSNFHDNKPWICSPPDKFYKDWNEWELTTTLSQYCVYSNGSIVEFTDIVEEFVKNSSLAEFFDKKFCKEIDESMLEDINESIRKEIEKTIEHSKKLL